MTYSSELAAPETGRTHWAAAAAAGVLAAIVTTAIGAVASAADVPLAVADEEIGLVMFALLTLVGSAVGAVLAGVFQKFARRPRRVFVGTTVALTALSILPDIAADATTSTKLTLIAAHVAASAIVVPAIAARLATTRRA
jgi:uncharacterized protein DUF6069